MLTLSRLPLSVPPSTVAHFAIIPTAVTKQGIFYLLKYELNPSVFSVPTGTTLALISSLDSYKHLLTGTFGSHLVSSNLFSTTQQRDLTTPVGSSYPFVDNYSQSSHHLDGRGDAGRCDCCLCLLHLHPLHIHMGPCPMSLLPHTWASAQASTLAHSTVLLFLPPHTA